MEDTGLMSLVELQKFLADELEDAGGESHFGRAFRPLTDGLGLAGQPKKEAPVQAKAPERKTVAPKTPARIPVPDATKFFDSFPTETSAPLIPKPPMIEPKYEPPSEPEPPRQTFRAPAPVERIEQPTYVEKKRETKTAAALEMDPAVQPPPVPQATFLRRLLAGIVDQLFVLGLLSVVLLITSTVLAKEGGVLSKGLLTNLQHPAYVRFAILGFATLWMSYLVLGVGILDMTIGMWVWGLRINYPLGEGDSRFARKLMRIISSFFLEALVIPSVLLVIRVKGKNLVDMLSGSYLYRTA